MYNNNTVYIYFAIKYVHKEKKMANIFASFTIRVCTCFLHLFVSVCVRFMWLFVVTLRGVVCELKMSAFGIITHPRSIDLSYLDLRFLFFFVVISNLLSVRVSVTLIYLILLSF